MKVLTNQLLLLMNNLSFTTTKRNIIQTTFIVRIGRRLEAPPMRRTKRSESVAAVRGWETLLDWVRGIEIWMRLI